MQKKNISVNNIADSDTTTSNTDNNNKIINENIEKFKKSKTKSLRKEQYSYTEIVEIIESVVKCSVLENISIYNSVYNENNELIGYVDRVEDIYIEVITIIHNDALKIGQTIFISNEKISINFPKDLFNIVIDTFGNLLMCNEDVKIIDNNVKINVPIKYKAPCINDRKTLNEQFVTGVNAIDILYPIGHGQRMLLIGDRKTYKTSTIMTMIKTEHYNSTLLKNHQETIFVYVSVGQRKSNFVRFINNVFDFTEIKVIAVVATSSDPLGIQILAPEAAMSIANYYAKNYKYKVCVFIDDLLKQAIAIREQSLMAGRLPGRESYPSNIFYAHSSLLERAFNYKSGGSITCIPVVECIDGDLTGYIQTNLVSITDGQIYNSKQIMDNLLVPPVSTELSVSRTGSSVQSLIFKELGSKCKKIVAMYNKTLNFYLMYKDSCDNQIKQKIKEGLFINTILYNQIEVNMHFINQIICMVIIAEMDKILESVSLIALEQQRHYLIIKNIISNAYSDIVDTKSIFDKIGINSITKSTIEIITNIVVKHIGQELEKIVKDVTA